MSRQIRSTVIVFLVDLAVFPMPSQPVCPRHDGVEEYVDNSGVDDVNLTVSLHGVRSLHIFGATLAVRLAPSIWEVPGVALP